MSEVFNTQSSALDFDFSPDANEVAIGAADGTIHIYSGGRLKATWIGHTGRVLAVRFNADGSRLASVGMDNTVRVWDVLGRELSQLKIAVFPLITEGSGADRGDRGLAFSPRGDKLAVGSDKAITIWRVRSLSELIDGARIRLREKASSSATESQIARR